MKVHITESGFIKIRNGNLQKLIYPHQSIDNESEEVQKAIKEHSDFEKYRTQENADAYEAKLKELEPTTEELEQQKRNRMVLEAGDFHSAIALLSLDNGKIKEVYAEDGNDTGLTPISALIDSAISQLPKKKQVKFTKLLEKRSEFRRTNKDVISIMTAIGMNDEQMDEFFTKAKEI